MRIAIIGGSPEDERHLARLAEKAGQAPVFLGSRPSPALAPSGLPASSADEGGGVLEQVLEQLEREANEPGSADRTARPLRALVFDAGERADAAALVLAAVRRDPYFDRMGTLLIVHTDRLGTPALPAGFDDFVLAPCGVREILIRVRALRYRRASLGGATFVDDSGVVVDEASRDVIVDGRAVQLTAREFALFTYLCEWRGKVLSREHLLARVWGSRYSGGRRTVDIHVRRLRAKLGASLAIETLRGSGYRLRRDPAAGDVDAAELASAFSSGLAPSYPAPRALPILTQIPEPFSKVS
jgi:DNA-binding winged helix-turn-helix (wHTH) protein